MSLYILILRKPPYNKKVLFNVFCLRRGSSSTNVAVSPVNIQVTQEHVCIGDPDWLDIELFVYLILYQVEAGANLLCKVCFPYPSVVIVFCHKGKIKDSTCINL